MLEKISHELGGRGDWAEGWIATRDTLRYDHTAFNPDILDRLRGLEQLLRPRTLVDKIQAVVLHDEFSVLDFNDIDLHHDNETAEGYQRTDQIARELGRLAAGDRGALAEVLAALVNAGGRVLLFGRGLGESSAEPVSLWRTLTEQFAKAPANRRNPLLLLGFLSGLHEQDRACAATLLDAAVADEVLGPLLPVLQTAVPADANGVARLSRALALDRAPGAAYRNLAGGKAVDNVPGAELRGLLRGIAAKPDGLNAAMEILSMRLYSDANQQRPTDPDLVQAARDLLVARRFRHDERDRDMRLGRLVKAGLSGPEGQETARLLWRNFGAAVANGDTYATEQHGLLKGLFSTHPTALLDEIGIGDPEYTKRMLRLVHDSARFGDNPIEAVSVDTLLTWCRGDPPWRFPFAASIVTPVQGGMDGAVAQWTPAASALLEEAPDRVSVLERFLKRFYPMSWSGSLAAILSARAELLRGLAEHPDRRLAEHAMRAHEHLQGAIAIERQQETLFDQLRDERFE
jgi:hypothetical protein